VVAAALEELGVLELGADAAARVVVEAVAVAVDLAGLRILVLDVLDLAVLRHHVDVDGQVRGLELQLAGRERPPPGGEDVPDAQGVVLLLGILRDAGPRHHGHQLGHRTEEASEALRRHLHVEPGAKLLALGRDSGRPAVGVADAGANAADGLHGCVGDGDAVCPQTQGLDQVCGCAQAADDDQRDLTGEPALVPAPRRSPRPGRRG